MAPPLIQDSSFDLEIPNRTFNKIPQYLITRVGRGGTEKAYQTTDCLLESNFLFSDLKGQSVFPQISTSAIIAQVHIDMDTGNIKKNVVIPHPTS